MFKRHETWYVYGANNFETFMYPYFLCYFLIGYFPYKIESSNYVTSKLRFTCSTVIFISYAISLIFAVHRLNVAGAIVNTGMKLHYICYLLLSSTVVFAAYFASRKTQRMLQRLSEVTRRVLPPRKFRKWSRLLYAKDAIEFVLTVSVIFVIIANSDILIASIVSGYATILILISTTAYTNYVILLRICFETINESLLRFRELLVTDQPHLLRKTYHKKKNPSLLKQLRAMKEQQLKISETVQQVNDAFGNQMICKLVVDLFDITFNFYFTILSFFDTVFDKTFFYFRFVYFAFHAAKLIWIVWNCDLIKHEARNVGVNIHRIIMSTFDETMTIELEMFSLQVMLQDNRMSAKGLKIDATLLTEITSTFVTYVLVLLQFKLNSFI